MEKMCWMADAAFIGALLPLLSRATFDFLVCVGMASGLPGRLAVTGDSMEAGPANYLLVSLVTTCREAREQAVMLRDAPVSSNGALRIAINVRCTVVGCGRS
jgi:hypothetical protein